MMTVEKFRKRQYEKAYKKGYEEALQEWREGLAPYVEKKLRELFAKEDEVSKQNVLDIINNAHKNFKTKKHGTRKHPQQKTQRRWVVIVKTFIQRMRKSRLL